MAGPPARIILFNSTAELCNALIRAMLESPRTVHPAVHRSPIGRAMRSHCLKLLESPLGPSPETMTASLHVATFLCGKDIFRR